ALDLGYTLHCPLPFERTSYEQDFSTDDSVSDFRRLLGHAGSILELDGSRETEQRQNLSYEAAGRIVLNHCEVLLAVWDGQEAHGVGGTAGIVALALEL